MIVIIFIILIGGCSFAQEAAVVAGYDCSDCHEESGWENPSFSEFNHNTTQFPLIGAHRGQYCTTCHTGGTLTAQHDFLAANTLCSTCHLDVHQSQLGDNCSDCHGDLTWQISRTNFEHDNTGFSLLGAHRAASCDHCHQDSRSPSFASTPTDCYSCHINEYNQSEPDHASAGISTECADCHPVERIHWQPAAFEHDINTAYPLTGAHFSAECAGCHQGNFTGTPIDCWSCHEDDYLATSTALYPDAPDHSVEEVYVEDCEICHSTITWEDGEVDHSLTAFPLSGAHQEVNCETCHGKGYDLSNTCDGCHLPSGLAATDYSTAEFDHVSHPLPADCSLCHNDLNWSENTFSHTAFNSSACESCHLIEHTEITTPSHGNDNIGTACGNCHLTDIWEISEFQHTNLQTGYELMGLHIITDCNLCHSNNLYNNTPANCENDVCHLTDYNNTTLPPHNEYGYPVGLCDACHQELGWEPDVYGHSIPLACTTCHQPEYNDANNPRHLDSDGFTTSCEDCHTSTTTWTEASYDHNLTVTTCVTCHLAVYNDSTDPDHDAAGFGQDCEICHNSTTDWHDASFDHSFPIGSNDHQDEQNETCQSCHTILYQAPDFSCTLSPCHQGIDGEHSDDGSWETCTVGGNNYTYDPNALDNPQCTNCHPNGSEDDCEGDARSFQKKHLLDQQKLSPR